MWKKSKNHCTLIDHNEHIKVRDVYIGKYPPPPQEGRKYRPMSFGRKNMKRGRRQGGALEKKDERGKTKGNGS
jgi:hypothetical protein